MSINREQRTELNSLIHEILFRRDKVCLRCGKPEFQASHIYPKGTYRKMEFDTKNIIALCWDCHFNWWHKNPIEAFEWLRTILPKKTLDYLKLRVQVTGSGSRDYKTLILFLKAELKQL